METSANKLWYPTTDGKQRASFWWYYGRALFVSRHDYLKIFWRFLAVGIPLGLIGLIFKIEISWSLALLTGFVGLALLLFSLMGLYLQYGHLSTLYFKKLLSLETINKQSVVADIHIGTYRHSYLLSEQLPESTIYSVDCKQEDRFSEELAVREVQALETPPAKKEIVTIFTKQFNIALADNSCDVVVFGFGTHEIPEKDRDHLFAEAKRILKPEGKVFLFEHGIDFMNFLIFGPVIKHVTTKKTWENLLNKEFKQVKTARLFAVNLFSATNLK